MYYNTYSIIANAARAKNARSAGVFTHYLSPTAIKLSRESNGTPWGSALSKSGAYLRPIIANVARKRRSAFWQCRRRFCVSPPVFCSAGGFGVAFVRPRCSPVAGGC